ncbi:MAG: gliding motility-associated C-terminal domain-containing protein [Bacteroidia bacterium]
MKRLFFISCIICLFVKSEAQNLVPNGSFEDTIANPNWASYLPQVCTNWLSPLPGSSDCFSDINPFCLGCASLLRTPRTGIAYGGLYTWQIDDTVSNFHEAMEVQLTDSLIAGKKYCVSFYVCRLYVSNYSCASIGTYFSDTAITNSSQTLTNYTPQVSNNAATGNLLIDTANWTLVSGSFIASGGEKFMTLTNFATNQLSDTIHVGHEYYNFQKYAYYFVDDVSVILCDDTIIPPPSEIENYLYVPTAFSPNGDGNNDLLFVRGKNIDQLNFSVYDRWGQRVFETNDINVGWDGRYNGEAMENAVFVYYLTLTYADGKTEIKKGNVSLIK